MMLIGKEARDALIKGVNIVADAVSVTLGPKGKVAAIYRGYGTPEITKDGVTVARAIEVEDPLERIGAELIREAAIKTNEIAGDGTTTATVLTRAFINNVTSMDEHPVEIKRAVDEVIKTSINRLIDESYKVNGDLDKIAAVATIAANNDPVIGSLIREAINRVGEDGILLFGASSNSESSVESVEGMQFDCGYASPYFITNAETQTVEYDNPYILITDYKIESAGILEDIVNYCIKADRPLVVVADDFEAATLATIIRNRMQSQSIKIACVKMNGFGDYKMENLIDLATFTGGTVVTKQTGKTLDNMSNNDFGQCGRVVLRKNKSIFVDGRGSKEDMKIHLENVIKQIPVESIYNRGKYSERVARLGNNVATIRIGAFTESELKEKMDRVEDAINATKHAIEYGVVDGGGITLHRIASTFKGSPLQKRVATALSSPYELILESCNKKLPDNIDLGFNAATEEFVDMKAAGIFDTVTALKIALETAGSITNSVLMSEVCINAGGRDKATPVPFG